MTPPATTPVHSSPQRSDIYDPDFIFYGIPIPAADREATMNFVFEFLTLSETFSRRRADLACEEYSRTQALLCDQKLACQREADKVNSVVAASAYFKQALKESAGNTVFSMTAPKGNGSSEAPEKHLYMSNCVVDFIRRLPSSAQEQQSLVSPS
ncbi:hypothetical protein FIBSPDRAFT_944703 [Athelia psychrophila]|uniref:Uncharacterized protein n=1 Tax=Athelia psychrophila TaxID=1759441 RepID=A0A166UY05_9AGAM|nr:hypothetical protein FIBSPDRAFT_944703 [Fibularhizoctonia sp. CBS 109695]